uniref:C-type lectin domain-containing protein n=1 Tax=Oryzias sinensis TaxID=183150 RepID=A0A8C7X3V9_9TELE
MRLLLRSVVGKRELSQKGKLSIYQSIFVSILTYGKPGCPSGWIGFGSSCYFFSRESKSWDEARKFCRTREADLLAINSTDEKTFLVAFSNIPVWIGLTDKVQEGTWKWVDGSPLTLKFWEENQPDNGGGSIRYGEEDCAEIRETSGSWNDIKCETSMRWICEKEVKNKNTCSSI